MENLDVESREDYGNFKCGPDEDLIPLIDMQMWHADFILDEAFDLQTTLNLEHLLTLYSDPLIMHQTILTCKAHSSAISAHSLQDIQGFGRREIKTSPEKLTVAVRYQIEALEASLDAEGLPLHHVKPHGILYGMIYKNKEIYRAVYAGVPEGTTGLPLVAKIYGDVKYNVDETSDRLE